MRKHLIWVTVMLIVLTACGVSPTLILNSTSISTATEKFIATPIPGTTPTSALGISSTAAAYLQTALEIMQKNGIHRYQVDWNAVAKEAFLEAQHAQSEDETYSAIRNALREAGGRHSVFLTPDKAAELEHSTVSDNPPPRGKMLLGKLGFIAIGEFISPILEEAAKYATSVQQLIHDLDASGSCGWLVDLREDKGGNMWPMMAGLGPILGEGKNGAFINPDGQEANWLYHDGQALLGGEVLVQVTEPAYQLKNPSPPVAVLTGEQTASSGEAVVVSFRGRPHTRSFGYPTAGLSTGNSGFPLSDGAVIVLTSVVFADRTGQVYGDQIIPDEVVDSNVKFTRILGEIIHQPAIDWLMAQPTCSTQK